jgi:hypothetical protein
MNLAKWGEIANCITLLVAATTIPDIIKSFGGYVMGEVVGS